MDIITRYSGPERLHGAWIHRTGGSSLRCAAVREAGPAAASLISPHLVPIDASSLSPRPGPTATQRLSTDAMTSQPVLPAQPRAASTSTKGASRRRRPPPVNKAGGREAPPAPLRVRPRCQAQQPPVRWAPTQQRPPPDGGDTVHLTIVYGVIFITIATG